jgi:hypothetical protein
MMMPVFRNDRAACAAKYAPLGMLALAVLLSGGHASASTGASMSSMSAVAAIQ